MKIVVIISLFVLGVLALSTFLPLMSSAYASSKQTEYFVLNLPGTNVKCNAEDYNMTVNPTSTPAQGSYPASTYAFCTIPLYSGPTLSVHKVILTLYTVDEGCGSSCVVSGNMTDKGSSGMCTTCGNVYSYSNEAVTVGSGAHKCSNAQETTITLSSGPFKTLISGDYFQAVFDFSGEVLLCSGSSTESQIAITGSQQVVVPQFPLGMFAILGIAMPAIILLRARYLAPKIKSS